MHVLGIDIGGTGIKGAPVDTGTGELVQPRYRIATPQPSTPGSVAEAIAALAGHFDWHGPIGCGFPGVVRDRRAVLSAANVDGSWVGADAASLIQTATDCHTSMVNDADAAGLAEMTFGAGRDARGVVFVVTLGTGIGTALFTDGRLVPNVELGHMKIRGVEAEKRASSGVRKAKHLSWKRWGRRLTEYLAELELLFSPSLFIIGGGVSRKFEKLAAHVAIETKMIPAQFRNDAGIIGAAYSVIGPAVTPSSNG